MTEDFTSNQGHASDKTHARIENAAGRVKQQASDAAHATKEKVDGAAGRAEQRAHRAADSSARGAHRVADKAADWRQRGGAGVDRVREQAASLFDSAREFMREKPVESAAIALVAGWLIGRMLTRRG